MRMRRVFMVELLVTMVVIGVLVRIALPRYRETERRAVAASIMGDVHAIRVSAFTYYTEHGAFPPDAGVGKLPTQLIDNLPKGFSFDRTDYDYRWHAWTSTNSAGNTENLIGITVIVTDSRLAAQLVKSAGRGYIPVVTPNKVTFLISTSS